MHKTIQTCNRLMWTEAPVILKMRRYPCIQLLENGSISYLCFFEHLEWFPNFAGDFVCSWGLTGSFLSASFTPLCKREIILVQESYMNKCLWFGSGMPCIRYCVEIINPALGAAGCLVQPFEIFQASDLGSVGSKQPGMFHVGVQLSLDGSPNHVSV